MVGGDGADVTEPIPPSAHRPRSPSIPRKIDLGKLDSAFKRSVSTMSFRVTLSQLVADRRVYSSRMKRKKTEDSNARKEIWKSVFEPYVPPSHGDLGCELLSYLTEHRLRPWITGLQCLKRNSMRWSLQISAFPVACTPQLGSSCQGVHHRRNSPEDYRQRVFRLIHRTIEGGWKGTDREVRSAPSCLRHIPYSRWP